MGDIDKKVSKAILEKFGLASSGEEAPPEPHTEESRKKFEEYQRRKIEEELEELESIFGEVELKRPELIILVPRILENKHGYLAIRIEYLKSWADLGYPKKNILEEGLEKWYRVIGKKELATIKDVEDMIKNFYTDSETHSPVILAKSLESPVTPEQMRRAFEEKILQFRSLAVEYWKRHQL